MIFFLQNFILCKWEEVEKGSTHSIDNNIKGFKMGQVPFFPLSCDRLHYYSEQSDLQ